MNFYFIRVPLRKKVLKYGTPKPSISVHWGQSIHYLGTWNLRVLLAKVSTGSLCMCHLSGLIYDLEV